MIFDVSLENLDLYNGLNIEMIGGKKTINNLDAKALNIIGQNAAKILESMGNHNKLVLTGAAPIPVYLVIFHLAVHKFHEIYYRNNFTEYLIARH